MKFNLLLHIFALVFVALVGISYGVVTPEAYWKSVLPNTPMPKAIKDLLYTPTEWTEDESIAVGVGKGGTGKPDTNSLHTQSIYYYAKPADQVKDDSNEALLFLEKDLHQGKEMKLHFTKNTNQKSTFLPRKVADSIPFSSNEISQIFEEFWVKPNSVEAEPIKQTLSECESKGFEGEEKYCVTSLESMVDFSTEKLGKKVRAISTEFNGKNSSLLRKHVIAGVKKMVPDKAVVCHKLNYVYAVFYCHKVVSIRAYSVSLAGVDGTTAKAVAMCHTDTGKWNPKHLAFQVLKVKPGSVPVCHFLPEHHVVWVPY